ncbi:MAG: DUF721 domain-containing protein [Gammaproteobacteria bacterium]|nr:DUF721 domain-containing protein [Gammaproteobacteria bacterium]
MHSINRFISARITEKSLLLDQLNAHILPLLPAASHAHIKAANYANQVLVLLVDSPVWAARLRTQHKTIISSLQKQLNIPINTLQIKFEQPIQPESKPVKHSPVLSADSARLIRQTAEALTDEELKNALLRLSEKSAQ